MRWLVPVRRKRYAVSEGFSQLLTDCRADAKHTELVPVRRLTDLLVHPTAYQTAAGYRFNVSAFRQVAGLLCGGLPTVLFGLLSSTTASIDEAEAGVLRIYNQAVKLMGGVAVNHRLVLDKRSGHVVGLVGRSYKYVPNAEILNLASKYFKQAYPSYAMMRAELVNRELFLLATRKEAGVRHDGVEFRQGLAVYNSETTKRAIFTPRVLFDSSTKSYSHEPESKDNRMIHRRRKQFAVQLEGQITAAFQGGAFLEEAVQRYRDTMKIALSPVDKQDAVIQSISMRLVSQKLNALPVERVIASLRQVRELTRWEVYRSMVTVAGEFRSTERQLRMAAFRFLIKGTL